MLDLKIKIGQRARKAIFRVCEKIGFHVTPVFYESPIPDTRTLNEIIWKKETKMVGIDINEKNQLKLLSLFSSRFKEEYRRLPNNKTKVPHQYFLNNITFGSVDGEILYCMLRYFKPSRILEIGSGNTTYLSVQSIQKNFEEGSPKCVLTSVEPYPNTILREGFPGLSKLVSKKVQDLPISEFTILEENDVIFIDSSHALKIGSDVQYEFLEILPRLKKGVIVHFHDIFLPAEYPKGWVLNKLRFLNEQYLLQAFLAFNRSFEVIWAGSYMHLKHPVKLEAAFKSYKRNERWPSSFWIRKIN